MFGMGKKKKKNEMTAKNAGIIAPPPPSPADTPTSAARTTNAAAADAARAAAAKAALMKVAAATKQKQKESAPTITPTLKRHSRTLEQVKYTLSRIPFIFDKVGMLFPRKISQQFDDQLTAAGAKKLQGKRLVGIMAVTSIIIFIAGYLIVDSVIGSPVIGLIAGPFAIVIWWGLLLGILSLKIDKRAKEIEEFLPDFLQLCSANVKAGMPIDQALWFAARPEFGLLAKEVEGLARKTFGGEPFRKSLLELGEKFRSKTFRRTIRLINEGMESGGEMGDLLESVVWDIRNMKLLHQEVAGNVMMYVIFILFAAGIGSPFLFALSNQLLATNYYVMGEIDIAPDDMSMLGQSQVPMVMSGGSSGISLDEFFKFAIICIIMTGTISSMLIATIQTGSAKQGLKYIPFFVVIGIVVFLAVNHAMSGLLKGILKI